MSRLEAIAEEAVREAEETGLEGEEAIAYVNNRLSEYTGNNGEEESDSGESKLDDAIEGSAADGEANPDSMDSNYASNEAEASETADKPSFSTYLTTSKGDSTSISKIFLAVSSVILPDSTSLRS